MGHGSCQEPCSQKWEVRDRIQWSGCRLARAPNLDHLCPHQPRFMPPQAHSPRFPGDRPSGESSLQGREWSACQALPPSPLPLLLLMTRLYSGELNKPVIAGLLPIPRAPLPLRLSVTLGTMTQELATSSCIWQKSDPFVSLGGSGALRQEERLLLM